MKLIKKNPFSIFAALISFIIVSFFYEKFEIKELISISFIGLFSIIIVSCDLILIKIEEIPIEGLSDNV